MNFGIVKIMDIPNIPTSFILIIILFDAVFKYDDGAKFWEKRWTTLSRIL
jgi:hypothetical protein